jgi:hypothetical protein
VSKDQFTGHVACRVKGRHLTVQNGVVVFDLGAHTDTSAAVYRLDRGPAHADLASLPPSLNWGSVLDRTPLDNPSDGLVAVPLAAFVGVAHIDIRANAKTQPVGFDLTGLPAVLKAAAAQGCADTGHDPTLVQLNDKTAPAVPPQ